MTKDVHYKVGKNEKGQLVCLDFEKPVTLFVMPAKNALEMARALIVAAREIAEVREIKECLNDLGRIVQ